jgi:flavin-dependent dehydrogenase
VKSLFPQFGLILHELRQLPAEQFLALKPCSVLVVGAGPAGAELARQLAMAGVSVRLVDRLADLGQAAFSSAALPLEAITRFGLPAEVVASRWSCWQLLGPANQWRHWQQADGLGVVLDFAALRRWLAAEVRAWGGEVLLGTTVISSVPAPKGGMSSVLRNANGRLSSCSSEWVIDATGQSRSLIAGNSPKQDPLICGIGLEWLLRVSLEQWQQWADRLSFLLGSRWVPQGYGWVFPMQPGILKLGVCRLVDPGASQPPLSVLQRRVLERTGLEAAEVLDRHGGMIRSRIKRGDPHGQGRLLAVGDAVSTANLLGGEGIRHALSSARVLVGILLNQRRQADQLASFPLQLYRRQLDAALGWRWALSGRLARRTWLGLRNAAGDERLERLLQALQSAPASELSELLFNYRFERFGMRALPYLLGLRR